MTFLIVLATTINILRTELAKDPLSIPSIRCKRQEN